jgi:hypothetical protein
LKGIVLFLPQFHLIQIAYHKPVINTSSLRIKRKGMYMIAKAEKAEAQGRK